MRWIWRIRKLAISGKLKSILKRSNSFFSSYQEGTDNALVSQLIVVAVKELEYIIEFIKLDGIGESFFSSCY